MTQRPDTLETTLLVIELLRRIPRGRKVTASELHAQLKDLGLERDIRTMQRLLERLSEHFEIERDERSKPFGYRWKEQSRGLDMLFLSPQESLLLNLAQAHLKNLLPPKLMRAMDGFFSQAQRNLGDGKSTELERQWSQKVRVVASTQPLLPPKIADGILETVSDALYNNCYLELEYGNASGKLSTAKVMPLGLAQQDARLYLVVRYDGFDNERTLALHRIRRASASTLTFERPPEFDLQKYDADGRFAFGDGEQIALRFCVTTGAGQHLHETPLSTDQQIKDLGDGVLQVSATVVESALLERWLRGFGEDVWDVQRGALQTLARDTN